MNIYLILSFAVSYEGEIEMKKGVFMLIFISLFFLNVHPAGAVEKKERKWQDESVYLIMIDRFNNGDLKNDNGVDINDPNEYHGGDFQGVIDQLDYIKNMGFSAIELTPIFANEDGGYHGFWVNDFYKTDEHFGSISRFKKLIHEAHQRNMKVIIDLDVNHVGRSHPWLEDPTKKDWFIPQQEINKENDSLPKLNQENPEVKQYFIKAAKWWIEKTDIDGYRLYSVSDVPQSFWSDFSKEVKKVKKDFYLLGDSRGKDSAQLSTYKETGIDGFADYPLNEELKKAFAQPDQSFKGLFAVMEQKADSISNPYLNGTFMDNEQIVRFTSDVVKKNEHPGPRWKQALTFLYTTPGIPIVYYGSEIALDGGAGADNHRQMNFRTDKDLIDYITKIGELRSKLPSLTRGTMDVLYEKDGMAVYKRVYKDETTVMAINNTTKTKTVAISADKLADNKELRGLLNGGLIRSNEKKYTLTIDRDMSEIYVLTDKTGINISYIIAMAAVLIAFTIFIILVWKRSKEKERKGMVRE